MGSIMQGSGLDPLVQARHLVQSGSVTEARYLVRRTLAVEPSSASALTLAGQIDLRQSALDDAVRHFGRATQAVRQHDPRALLNFARAQQMAGLTADALATARRAATQFPDDVRPRGLIALLQVAAGRPGDAAATLRPSDAAVLDPDTAYKIASGLTDQPPHRDLMLALLVRAGSNPGRFIEPALRDLAIRSRPDDTWTLNAARRHLVLAPATVAVIDVVERAFRVRRYPVKQAAWLWQSCCLRPGDHPRLRRAAELLHEVKWPSHGIAANRLCLLLEPNNQAILHRIGDLFVRHRELSEDKAAATEQAVAWGREVLARIPRDPRIWDSVAGLYKDVGAIAEATELWPEILRRFRKYEVLYYNYGLFLDEQDRIEEAIKALRFALLMVPRYARASNLLSLTVTHRHDLRAAIRHVRWATVSNPKLVSCWQNLGSHLRAVGQYTRALAAYAQAEELAKAEGNQEQVATAQFNRGMSHITTGELEVGFRLLEARWATPGFPSPKRSFRHPIWQGPQKHRNAGLLAYMEQGLGDEVMMSWYFPLLRQDTRRLVVDCDERLIDLYRRTYEGIEFAPRSQAGDDLTRDPDLRYKIPIVHVPQYYVPELKTLVRRNWHWGERAGSRFPARLVLEPDRLERWDRWLEERFPGRPRLALSWRSRMHNRMRDQQYLTPEELAAALPEGAVGINLQYSSTDEEIDELRELGRQRGFEIVTPEGVDLTNDLEDVFALLQVSDAAVTPMISLAWMAGAVGCPGYIFRTSRERVIWQQFGLPFVPWAPSLRLFFRDRSECWTATIRDLNRTLTRYLASGPSRSG